MNQEEQIFDKPLTIFRKKYMRKDDFKYGYAIAWLPKHRIGRRLYYRLLVRYKCSGKWKTGPILLKDCMWGHYHYPKTPSKQQMDKIEHWIKREERCWERVKTLLVLDKTCRLDGGLYRYICDFIC